MFLCDCVLKDIMRYLVCVLILLSVAVHGFQLPLNHRTAPCARAHTLVLSEESSPSEVYQDMDGNVVPKPEPSPEPAVGEKPKTDMPIPEFGLPVPGWVLTFGGAALLGYMPSLIKKLSGE